MNLDLTGKYAVVCGSTQGLGYASAVELALLGANVTLIARDEKKLKEALKTLATSAQQEHNYLVADFQFPEQVKKVIDDHLTKNKIVNILVNNTGGPKGGPLTDAATDEFLQAFKSHLICNHLLVQAIVPSMKLAGYGRIVNIISTSVKQPIPDLGVSNTIRAAVANWAKTLANELGAFGITVNNVLPGLTATARLEYLIENSMQKTGKLRQQILEEMESAIPAKRIGRPDDFGSVVAFLCSPSAGYINGINLPVDGGKLASL